MERDLIREYWVIVNSLGQDDKDGEELAHSIYVQMTHEQKQELIMRFCGVPSGVFKGYDESCRPQSKQIQHEVNMQEE